MKRIPTLILDIYRYTRDVERYRFVVRNVPGRTGGPSVSIAVDMSRFVLGLLLAAIVFACFSPALRNGFTVYDDPGYVTENTHVNTGLTRQNVAWAFTAAHSSNWHPLTWISHAVDCS